MIIRRNSLAAALLVSLSVAGCADGAADTAGATAAKDSSTAPSAQPIPSEPIPSIQPVPGQPGMGDKTLTGKITAGTEPGCLLLNDHLLLINDPRLKAAAKAGASVVVIGRAEQGTATTCQQGTPFVVTAVRANKPGDKGNKTLTGKVTAGAEPGCLLVNDQLLLIDDPMLRAAAKAGTSVIVTGRIDKSAVTACMQGTPFVVTTLNVKS